jgi:hypothetical protein
MRFQFVLPRDFRGLGAYKRDSPLPSSESHADYGTARSSPVTYKTRSRTAADVQSWVQAQSTVYRRDWQHGPTPREASGFCVRRSRGLRRTDVPAAARYRGNARHLRRSLKAAAAQVGRSAEAYPIAQRFRQPGRQPDGLWSIGIRPISCGRWNVPGSLD